MSFHNEIRTALENEIANVVGIPAADQRAWDNAIFKPTTGTSWVRMTLIPFTSRPAVRGPTPQILHTGSFVVDLFTPEGGGAAEAETLADAVRARFNVDTVLTSGSANVRFRYSERGQGVVDSPWYRLPVDVRWYCYEPG